MYTVKPEQKLKTPLDDLTLARWCAGGGDKDASPPIPTRREKLEDEVAVGVKGLAQQALSIFSMPDVRIIMDSLLDPEMMGFVDLLVSTATLSAADKTALQTLYDGPDVDKVTELGLGSVRAGEIGQARTT